MFALFLFLFLFIPIKYLIILTDFYLNYSTMNKGYITILN